MSNGSQLSLAEIERRMAIVRDNIRQLIEQAAALSGAEDEERASARIAQQNEELERLTKERDELLKLQKADPRMTTWHSLVSSTAIFAVAALATMNWHGPAGAYGWTLVFILSLCVAVATLTLYMSTVRIGPFRSALIMNLEPLLATLLSAVLLGEVITGVQALGAAVMLTALVAFQLWR